MWPNSGCVAKIHSFLVFPASLRMLGIVMDKGQRIPCLGILSDMGAGMLGAHQGPVALQAYDANKPPAQRLFDTDLLHRLDMLKGGVYDSSHSTTPEARAIGSIVALSERIADAVAQMFASSPFNIVLSGDHSSAAGVIAGIQRSHPNKRLGVIWIDAHVDMHTPYTSPSGNMHGMPLGAALRLNSQQNPYLLRASLPTHTEQLWQRLQHLSPKPLQLQDIVFIAARAVDEAEQHVLNTHQALSLGVEAIDEAHLSDSLKRIQHQLADCDSIYISFDVDSLDPESAPATGTPVSNGLGFDAAMALLKGLLKSPKVCGWGCTELNPLREELSETQRQQTIAYVWRLLDGVIRCRLQ